MKRGSLATRRLKYFLKNGGRRIRNFSGSNRVAVLKNVRVRRLVGWLSSSNFMKTKRIGIIMNGVTGRMGTNQHLQIARASPDSPQTSTRRSRIPTTKFFDASGTFQRAGFIEKAVKGRKAVYCEKPTAVESREALRLANLCDAAGLKNGVVQDELWLSGIRKFRTLHDQRFFGRILSVRGGFGYWVFTGEDADQPAQRPSWNYRKEDCGGIIVDMLCHWRHVIDDLFGKVKAVSCMGATHIPKRLDERGNPCDCTSDDSCYATFECEDGVVCQFNSSWTVRFRRDELLTMQVDGTHGSAIVGLRKCWVQSVGTTPRPTWNPDSDQPIDFFKGWPEVPDSNNYDNAFKIQWEEFLKHVAKLGAT
jgi:predicted dehydrogenase